jgi:hypothetical protein
MTRIEIPIDQLTTPATQKSLALNAILQELRADKRYTILDLGPARGINVDFWSQSAGRLYVEDFYRTWLSSVSLPLPEEVTYQEVFEKLLPYPEGTRLDIILTWDLFNYFDPMQNESFVRYLGRFCQTGTFLLALISSLHHIPAEPTTFKILDRDRIIYEVSSSETRPCPRYQARDIAKMMVGFKVFNSFILRNGIQEHLFVYDALPASPLSR